MTEHEGFEKEDRRERFQRKRDRATTGVAGGDVKRKRRPPYKREHLNHEGWDEEDEWMDDEI